MEELACPLEKVSPMTDLSRNLTTMHTATVKRESSRDNTGVTSRIICTQLQQQVVRGSQSMDRTQLINDSNEDRRPCDNAPGGTPDSTGSFRLKTVMLHSDCSASEGSETEPSPLMANNLLQKRVLTKETFCSQFTASCSPSVFRKAAVLSDAQISGKSVKQGVGDSSANNFSAYERRDASQTCETPIHTNISSPNRRKGKHDRKCKTASISASSFDSVDAYCSSAESLMQSTRSGSSRNSVSSLVVSLGENCDAEHVSSYVDATSVFRIRPVMSVTTEANSCSPATSHISRDSPSLRKNSSQGYSSSTSDGFALEEVFCDENGLNIPDHSLSRVISDTSCDKENQQPQTDPLASLLSAPLSSRARPSGRLVSNTFSSSVETFKLQKYELKSRRITPESAKVQAGISSSKSAAEPSLLLTELPAASRSGQSVRRNLSFAASTAVSLGVTVDRNVETPVKTKRSSRNDHASKRSRLCLIERPVNCSIRCDVPRKLPKHFSEPHIDLEAAESVIAGSRLESLPTSGVHHSCALPTISACTLNDIILGKYDDVINSCCIVDCRWPYEFNGGHIKGAQNLYTHELVFRYFLEEKFESKVLREVNACEKKPSKKDILVFHCEFSSERGPRMSQYLRQKDREINVYPNLLYPDVYILLGGYKEFFNKFKEHCVPQEYLKMVDSRFVNECRLYRSQSKTFEKKFSRNQSSRF